MCYDIELMVTNLYHECNLNIALAEHGILNEADEGKKVDLESIKKFIVTLKEKVIELFKKTIDSFTEIQGRVTHITTVRFEERNFKNKENVNMIGKQVANEYFKNHKYYSIPYANQANDLLEKFNFKSTVSEILDSFDVTGESGKEKGYTETELGDKIGEVLYNHAKDFKSNFDRDIRDLKIWREKTLKIFEDAYKDGEMNGDSAEQRQRYISICKTTMTIYTAILKGYVKNAKARLNMMKILNEKLDSLEEKKEKED